MPSEVGNLTPRGSVNFSQKFSKYFTARLLDDFFIWPKIRLFPGVSLHRKMLKAALGLFCNSKTVQKRTRGSNLGDSNLRVSSASQLSPQFVTFVSLQLGSVGHFVWKFFVIFLRNFFEFCSSIFYLIFTVLTSIGSRGEVSDCGTGFFGSSKLTSNLVDIFLIFFLFVESH